MLFGMAIRVPSWLKILSLIVSPLPRSCRVKSSLTVFLFRFSGVPRTFIAELRVGIWTSMYFFLSAILFCAPWIVFYCGVVCCIYNISVSRYNISVSRYNIPTSWYYVSIIVC